MVVGPYEHVDLVGGGSAPLYLLRYDERGRPGSPRSEEHLRRAAAEATDVFLFAHGWNNVFAEALRHYRGFVAGFLRLRADLDLPVPAPYRPLLVGVMWPSASLVADDELGPAIAGGEPGREAGGEPGREAGGEPGRAAASAEHGADAVPRATEELLRFVAGSLDPVQAAQVSELVDGVDRLDAADARQLADLLLPVFPAETGGAAPSARTLLDAWRRLDARAAAPTIVEEGTGPDDFGTAASDPGGVGTSPVAVAGLGSFDPRTALRMASVWKMKGRAGTVGAGGVAQLVRAVLRHSGARLHLVGHSFGARLLLSAVAAGPVARPATSMLLLQAAVNRWCFAADVAGTGRAGGYRPVLGRVQRPVAATWTVHDMPLRTVFHLVMRDAHLGEPHIAAIGDEQRYGALGGYGPAGLGAAVAAVPVTDPGRPYARPAAAEVLAVDASRTIGGHGAISNPSTWWLLHWLARP